MSADIIPRGFSSAKQTITVENHAHPPEGQASVLPGPSNKPDTGRFRLCDITSKEPDINMAEL